MSDATVDELVSIYADAAALHRRASSDGDHASADEQHDRIAASRGGKECYDFHSARSVTDRARMGCMGNVESSSRLNVTLAPEHAEKLRRMAAQSYMQEGTLARSLLSRAIDEADIDANSMVDLLNRIPGALDRAREGRQQGRHGQTIALEDL